MTEVERALSQLDFIHAQMAASTRFRGFAPMAVATTGLLAFALATAQTLWPDLVPAAGTGFILGWLAVAVAAVAIVGTETLIRSQRLHGQMASAMMGGTLRIMLPFGAAGAVIAFVIERVAPQAGWALPGLWQLLTALIGFSAVATLPRAIIWPAGWYFICGAVVLALAGRTGAATPWMMGLPFGIGQLMVAWTLHRAALEAGDER